MRNLEVLACGKYQLFTIFNTIVIDIPFKKLDLQRAVELTVSRMSAPVAGKSETDWSDASPFMLSDRIFVRHRDTMVKIYIEAILYIEAERNYCRIVTRDKEYLLATTLKVMEQKLPAQHFLRIHRSYIINISKVDEVADGHVVLGRQAIPLSKSQREDLLKRIRTI